MAQNQRNVFGAFGLIGLGILFLVGQMFGINVWSMLGFSWPVLVLVPGLVFLAVALTGDKKMAGFAVPGAIVTGTGAILWYQNMTGNWESWAYIWTLYPVFLGLAFLFMAQRGIDDKLYAVGRGFVNYGLIAFVLGAAFFELFIFHSNGALTGWILPLALIGGGAFMLLGGGSGRLKAKRKLHDAMFSDLRKNGYIEHGNDLQQRIDAAIAEDEPRDPLPFV